MYNVIIAEDELFVRLGIKNSISWEQYDMQVIADAENGQTAWEKAQKYKPDILITDLLMPVMDGKQLISSIQEAGMDPYIIVITCLEDFHLLKTLLSQGIRDYILKATITEEEIGRCLERARSFLGKHLPQRAPQSISYYDKVDECNQAIQDYFHGKAPEKDTAALLAKHHICLDNGISYLALCPVEAIYDFQGGNVPAPFRDIYLNMFDLLRKRTFTYCSCHSFLLEEQSFILILHYPDGEGDCFREDALSIMHRLHDELQDYLNIRFSLLLHRASQGLCSIKSAYQQALISLERHYLHHMNSVFLGWSDNTEDEIPSACQPLLQHKNWISRYLGYAAGEQFLQLVNTLIHNAAKSREEMTYSMMSISHFICSFFEAPVSDNKKQCDKLLVRYPYLWEGVSALNALLQSCEQYYLQYQKPRHRKEIDEALRIINQGYSNQNLSLSSIAEQVNLSETYFSTLFKQELEQPFVKYLSGIRIERAKTLLEQKDSKIFDIAIQCGFSDEAYFSRVFKKTTGVAPSEWRSLWFL